MLASFVEIAVLNSLRRDGGLNPKAAAIYPQIVSTVACARVLELLNCGQIANSRFHPSQFWKCGWPGIAS
jgi:hypothetical protein